MLKKVISAIVFALISLVIVWLGDIVLTCGLIIFAGIAMYEYCDAFKKKGFRPIYPVMALGLFAFYLAFCYVEGEYDATETLRFALLLITVMVLATLASIVFFHKKITVIDGAMSIFGSFYVNGLMMFLLLLRSIGTEGEKWFGFGPRGDGFYYLVIAVFATAMADTFAMFGGMLFGKKKLIPEVSPHKTIAGSISAVAGSTVLTVILGIVFIKTGLLTTLKWFDYLIIGFAVGFISQIGDLCASAMKRFCGIKDFGKIIPGHGGVLDRIDSHIYVIPVMFFYVIFRLGIAF